MAVATARPSRRTKQIPQDLERAVSSEDGFRQWGMEYCNEQIRRLKRVRIGLSRIVCSQAWFDANWSGAHMIVEEKGARICKLVSAPYPPGGDKTLMVPCRSRLCAGRLYPPNYMTSSGHCTDCQERRMRIRRRQMDVQETPRQSFIVDQSAMEAAHRAGNDYTGSV